MLKIEVYGSIRDHKLILPGRKKLQQELLDCQDCEIILTIKKRGKRSNAQNSYYHAVVVETVRHRLVELGHRIDHETCHEWIKHKFNSIPLSDADGVVIDYFPQSTADLNKAEFSELIERIREFCLDHLGIDIPPADKSLTLL
jgi:hypothetical protein